jgi:hypothetical protein
MKRYKSFFEFTTTTITIEFFIDETTKELKMMYNGKTVRFIDFVNKYPEASKIIDDLFDFIHQKYRKLAFRFKAKTKVEFIIKFINNYLYLKEDPLDVFIYDSGKISINLEDF